MAENLGTGTILDADGIRTEPRRLEEAATWGYEGTYLSPLPVWELTELFGTDVPPTSTVVEKWPSLMTHRGDGRYVVTSDGGDSWSVVFFGASGD